MKLCTLIQAAGVTLSDVTAAGLTGSEPVSAITSDSRQVTAGSLFIAVKGLKADGHGYIDQAFDKGAVAVIAQENPDGRKCVITVPDSRRCMSSVAAAFYGYPSGKMTLVGITGTNGKTTTSFILENIFAAAGLRTGVIGTVNIRYNGLTLDSPVTTPDAIDLQKSLFDMQQAGITHVVMEVSSHGLDLHRVDDCDFDAGIFTNLTQDHLDYHQDMDDYFNCKKRFFTHLLANRQDKAAAPAIINIDHSYGKELAADLKGPVTTVSTRTPADLTAADITDDINGICASVRYGTGNFEIKSDLTGMFNLENILCAAGAALALGITQKDVLAGIGNCRTIPGRLEKVPNAINRHLFVDYAHTPDALDSILAALKQRAPKRLICVFGCGGDRDRTKRPQMGQMVLTHSDIAIITSDNPRTENPDRILSDIIAGLDHFEKRDAALLRTDPIQKGYLVEADRRSAIQLAVQLSRPDDIIVVAGKGHETYQITNSGTIHFDDREELTQAAEAAEPDFAPIPWSVADIEEALGQTNAFSIADNSPVFSGVCTDSRKTETDQVFLALKGERFDAHTFIDDLIEKQVRAFVVDTRFWDGLSRDEREKYSALNLLFFVCDNTRSALGQLALFQRNRANVKVLAITGSSGKTTTRQICEMIFSSQYYTHATSGNLNNEIGVPLTLLKLCRAHEWAVIEMGMNHAGEIARLTRIARPDIAMVINTAGVHLEGLGSVENVAKAKAEIFEGLLEGGIAILPADDPRCPIMEATARENPNIKQFIFFGDSAPSTVSADHINTSATTVAFTVQMDGIRENLSIRSPGRFMVSNCLAAVAAATVAGIGINRIRHGLAKFSPVKGRMSIYPVSDNITLMDDTYNANPASVSGALDTLAAIREGKPGIAVLGDMLELGEDSQRLHRNIGRKAAAGNVSYLFVYGKQARFIVEGAVEQGLPEDRIFHGEKAQIAQKIVAVCTTPSVVLVKGSRGMAMETVITKLKELAAANA